MALLWAAKDPNEILDYVVDWAARLSDGDTITTSDFTIAPGSTSPPALVINTENFASTFTTVWLSGGEVDDVYFVLNRVTTAGGRTMDQTVKLKIKTK